MLIVPEHPDASERQNMSAQFGCYHFDDKPVERNERANLEAWMAPYGPDGVRCHNRQNLQILYAAFETKSDSCCALQPFVSQSGNIVTFDGRLDNREDLLRDLEGLPSAATDVAIIAAAFEKRGVDCLSKLIGDWALSVWMPQARSLLLAKDTIGTRPLYYFFERNEVRWSSVLGPLVKSIGNACELNKEYIAGWLSFFPATHLSPYVGVHSVPPSSYVLLSRSKTLVREYWRFDPAKRIRYRSDGEYEEHFRVVFGRSVARRLRSNHPVLAELSGGMDSSSIVCMADCLISNGIGATPRLDTISYYNDAEPNWNERPYFTKVEDRRGRTGFHIDFGSSPPVPWLYPRDTFVPSPGFIGNPALRSNLASCLSTGGNRVVLSGIGGDEVLGGVPNCVPELADLLATAEFKRFCRQLTKWALARRKPVFGLAIATLRAFLPPSLGGLEKARRTANWLEAAFVRTNREALRGYDKRLGLTGSLPSFEDAVQTLEGLRRQLSCYSPPPSPIYEKRYPYFDRDLLEFLFAVPRDQIVRANQRRSLMRRALRDVVPEEILNRRRKAFVTRSPVVFVTQEWHALMDMAANMLCASLGVVNAAKFGAALRETREGRPVSLSRLLRTIDLEHWLRHAEAFGVLRLPDNGRVQGVREGQIPKARLTAGQPHEKG
jgi:asparagine synthase (glutamine-hydrolysing)